MPNKCMVPGCKTGYASCKVKLSTFSVPKNEDLRIKWQKAILSTKPLTQKHVVCEKHFTSDQIIRSYMLKDDDGKVLAEVPLKHIRLVPNAIPTKFLHQNAEQNESSEKENLCVDENVLSVSNTQEALTDLNEISNERTNESLGFTETTDHTYVQVDKRSLQTAAKSTITSELNLFTELLAKSSEIQLPDNWYITKPPTNKSVAFYEIYWKNEKDTLLPITRRSLTIDQDMKASYSVHRRFINPLEFSLPQRFESLEIIIETIERFASLKICCGIATIADVNLVKETIGYIDDADVLRHKRCPIVTDKQQCDICKRVKKAIHQKKLRMQNREQINERTKRDESIKKNVKKSLKVTSLDALKKKHRAERCALKRAQKKKSESKEHNAGTTGKRRKVGNGKRTQKV